MKIIRYRVLALSISALPFLTFATTANAAYFHFLDLGSVGPSFPNSTSGYTISSSGRVPGYSYNISSNSRATVWSGASATDLGTLGGTTSLANGINDAGKVVGWASTPGDVSTRATVWTGTSATALGTLGGNFSVARAINNAGQIAGYSNLPGQDQSWRAVIWNGTTPTDLGDGYAMAINNAGQVVGFNGGSAVLWNGTIPTDLGAGAAYGINNLGQVVGVTPDIYYPNAAIWNGTTMTLLPNLGGSYSGAWSIHDNGRVVGYSSTAGDPFPNSTTGNLFQHATVWNGTTATDLNTRVDAPGWTLWDALAINPAGQIAGSAYNSSGELHAYLLTPTAVPLPAALPLFATGLGVLALLARRRRNLTNSKDLA